MSRRCIGMDVHRDQCEIAIWEGGGIRRGGRIDSRPEALDRFAERELLATDEVELATGEMIAASLPRRALRHVREWGEEHRRRA